MNNRNKRLSVVVLAAGKGTRMKSDLSKVLHKVVGVPMVGHVVNTARVLEAKEVIIVVSEDNVDQIKEVLGGDGVKFAVQKDRNGTGGAVKVALKQVDVSSGNVLVMYGDVPLINQETYQRMIGEINVGSSDLVVLGFDTADIGNKYGRLIAGNDGVLKEIIEYKDASEDERKLTLCNSGILVVKGSILGDLLKEVKNENANREYYLTDVVGIARSKGMNCRYIKAEESEVMGVNSKRQLAEAEEILQNRLRNKFMDQGVTLIDPKSVYFSCDTEIGRDVTIYPNVFFGKGVKVGNNVVIKVGCHLEKCKIEKGVAIGPYARLRPGAYLKEGCRIGNFVEIKNSEIGKGTKMGHLSYIGDCDIGDNVNVGALTGACNYDGYKKYRTKVGDRAFIGSGTKFIAPVEIGDGAITGAGSVIRKDVGQDDIAIARGEQINLEGKAKSYRRKREEK